MVKRISSSLLLSFLCCSYAQEVRDAQFPGGDKALQQFIRTHAIYDFIRIFFIYKNHICKAISLKHFQK